jgi:hypothetical protein
VGFAGKLASLLRSTAAGRVFITRKMLKQINRARIQLIKDSSNPFLALFFILSLSVFVYPLSFSDPSTFVPL